MIRIDASDKIAWIEMHGVLQITEIADMVDELIAHPDHIQSMDEIWDFRRACFSEISLDDLDWLAKFVGERLPHLAKNVVYITKGDLEFGMTRMWEAYSEKDAPQNRLVVKNIDKALDWLQSIR